MKGINTQKHAWLNEVPIQMGTCSSKAKFSHVLCQCQELHPWFSNICSWWTGSTSSQEKTDLPPNHSFAKYLRLLLLVMDYELFQSMEPQMLQTQWKSSQGLQINGNSKKLCSVYPWLPFLRIAVQLQPKGTLYKHGDSRHEQRQRMYFRLRDPTEI